MADDGAWKVADDSIADPPRPFAFAIRAAIALGCLGSYIAARGDMASRFKARVAPADFSTTCFVCDVAPLGHC